MPTVFDGDDAAYQDWLLANPQGYIINARRRLSPTYMVLHRAWCPRVSDYNAMARRGGFTERSYVKVCAIEIEDLRDWLCRNGRPNGTFSNECSLCNSQA